MKLPSPNINFHKNGFLRVALDSKLLKSLVLFLKRLKRDLQKACYLCEFSVQNVYGCGVIMSYKAEAKAEKIQRLTNCVCDA